MSKRIIAVRKTESNAAANSRQIWLAGLGAVSIARRQAGEFYDRLVNEGRDVQQRTTKTVTTLATDVRKQAEGVVGQARNRVGQNLQKVESIVGQNVTRSLNRMGVPSREDIQDLSKRVAELNRKVGSIKTVQASEQV